MVPVGRLVPGKARVPPDSRQDVARPLLHLPVELQRRGRERFRQVQQRRAHLPLVDVLCREVVFPVVVQRKADVIVQHRLRHAGEFAFRHRTRLLLLSSFAIHLQNPASPCASFAGPGFRLAYFRPSGSKRSASRGAVAPPSPSPCATFAGPGFRLAYWAIRPKRSTFRSAGADPSASRRTSFAGPAFRPAYWAIRPKRSAFRGFAPFAVAPCHLCGPSVPAGLLGHSAQTLDLQVRWRAPFAVALCQLRWPRVPAGLFSPFGLKRSAFRGFAPFAVAPCHLCWPRVPAGLFSPFGLKTLGLQGRCRAPLAFALCHLCGPRVPAGLLGHSAQTLDLQVRWRGPFGFAPDQLCWSGVPAGLLGHSAQTLGLQGLRPLRSRAVPPLRAQRSGWLIGPFGPNA